MLSPIVIADALAFLLLLYTLKGLLSQQHRFPLPPGPPGLPIIGNLLDTPSSHAAQVFSKWAAQWGDIISLSLPGQTMIVLNTPRVAIELLDKKGAIYSDRPILPVAGHIMGWDQTLGLQRYGSAWREGRRMFSKMLGSRKNIDNLADQLEEENHRFLVRLSAEPEQLLQNVRRLTAAIILRIAYGYNVEKEEDDVVELVDKAMSEFSIASAPGASYADVFPILTHLPAWFPGAGWKRRALRWREDFEAMRNVPFQLAKQLMRTNKAAINFVTDNLKNPEFGLDPERETAVKNAAAALYGAGAHTTVSTTCAFFLAMMCFPEVQEKAQNEIERVIGNERLPTLSDIDDLPYVRALTWEVLRWQPVAPLGIPHSLMQDDIHDGYLLPKGAIVFPNIWAMARDPSRYKNPETFNPDRFLPSDGTEPEYDPREIVFGFGRRICAGTLLAESSIFLVCALSLAVFRITKPVLRGEVVQPSLEFTSGTIIQPPPFKCSIVSRSAKAATLISATRKGAYV